MPHGPIPPSTIIHPPHPLIHPPAPLHSTYHVDAHAGDQGLGGHLDAGHGHRVAVRVYLGEVGGWVGWNGMEWEELRRGQRPWPRLPSRPVGSRASHPGAGAWGCLSSLRGWGWGSTHQARPGQRRRRCVGRLEGKDGPAPSSSSPTHPPTHPPHAHLPPGADGTSRRSRRRKGGCRVWRCSCTETRGCTASVRGARGWARVVEGMEGMGSLGRCGSSSSWPQHGVSPCPYPCPCLCGVRGGVVGVAWAWRGRGWSVAFEMGKRKAPRSVLLAAPAALLFFFPPQTPPTHTTHRAHPHARRHHY